MVVLVSAASELYPFALLVYRLESVISLLPARAISCGVIHGECRSAHQHSIVRTIYRSFPKQNINGY